MCSVTLAVASADRGTKSVDPTVTSMRCGMRLTSRSDASLMPTNLAASAGLSVRGATQAVQLARGPRCEANPR